MWPSCRRKCSDSISISAFSWPLFLRTKGLPRSLQRAGGGACGRDAVLAGFASSDTLIEDFRIVGREELCCALSNRAGHLFLFRAGGGKKSKGYERHDASHQTSPAFVRVRIVYVLWRFAPVRSAHPLANANPTKRPRRGEAGPSGFAIIPLTAS